MTSRALAALAIAVCVSACAASPYPDKRPMPAHVVDAMDNVPVVLAETNLGVAKGWFMQDSSVATAQFGLIGALASALTDAAMNVGPMNDARQVADDLNAAISPDDLDASLRAAFEQLETNPHGSPVVSVVTSRQPILDKAPSDGALEVSVTYTMSEDGSALRFVADASYAHSGIAYQTPYSFNGAPPAEQRSGPLYRNRFSYETARHGPSLDDISTEAVMSNVDEWLKDDAAALKAEIEQAHVFFARFIVADLEQSEPPSFDGENRVLETQDDGRTVRMIGSGREAGAYISAPSGAPPFPSLGNTIAIAEVNVERIRELEKRARKSNGG